MTVLPSLAVALASLVGPALQAPLPPAGVTVAGVVVNGRTGDPLADAHVSIVELGRETSTGADGRFAFANVAPGTYTLAVSTIGFIYVRRPLVVSEGVPLDLTIPLAEGAGTYRESVTVTGTSVSEGGAGTTLNESELQQLRGVMADDPVRALQALPGVMGGNDFRAEFSVRGSAFRQVGTVIDGTPTAQLFHTLGGADGGSISMINTDVLSGASLTAGPQARKDGDWLGATVTFDVREGSRDRTAARVAVSGTNSSVVAEGPLGRDKQGSWLLSMRKSYIGWIVKKVDPSITGTFGFDDTQAKVVYDITPHQQVQFTAVGGRATFFRPGASSPNDTRRSSSWSGMTSASWRHVGTRLVVSQRLSFVAGRETDNGSQLQQQAYDREHTLLWRGDGTLSLTRAWTLDAGLFASTQHAVETLRDFATQSGQLRVRNLLSFENRRAVGGGWGELARQTAAGRLAAGLRYTIDPGGNRTIVSPWLVGARTIGAFSLFAGVDRSGQLPSLEDLGQASTPLQPERAAELDAGARRTLGGALHVRATVFYRRESDVLRRASENRLVNGVRVAESPFPDFSSTIDDTTRGVDIVLERRAARGPVGWFGYTWAHTQDRDRVSHEVFDADFDQRHTVNVFVEQRISYRAKVSAKLRYGSNFPLQGYFEGTPDALTLSALRNGVRLPSYLRLDLDAGRTFTFPRARLTLFLEFVNVTDHKNFSAADGTVRSNLSTTGFTQELIPFVPSAGFLLEF